MGKAEDEIDGTRKKRYAIPDQAPSQATCRAGLIEPGGLMNKVNATLCLVTLGLAALGLAALALTGCQPQPVPAPPSAADPKAFVDSVYAKCRAAKDFTILGDNAGVYLDGDTLALMGADAHKTAPGQMGVVQDDPFCSFGDYADVTPAFTTRSVTGATAVVEGTMHPDDKDGSGPRITYTLTLENGAWRFHDISSPPPGLRAIVMDAHAATPLAFMQALFAHYTNNTGTEDYFSPLNDTAPAYFDPEMVGLMADDSRLAGGEVGALDWDPIAGGQDSYRMQVAFTVKSQNASAATVIAHISNLDGNPVALHDTRFDLVSIGGRWRIHDITDKWTGSLRNLLITSNKAAAARSASSSTSAPAQTDSVSE